MAAKFFTGLPLDGPDPECVKGHGEAALAAAASSRPGRRSTTRGGGRAVPVTIGASRSRQRLACRQPAWPVDRRAARQVR